MDSIAGTVQRADRQTERASNGSIDITTYPCVQLFALSLRYLSQFLAFPLSVLCRYSTSYISWNTIHYSITHSLPASGTPSPAYPPGSRENDDSTTGTVGPCVA